ncbi:hypothetical protein B0H14DRAFT_2982071 [Mycena olivaceomarginata]|nr:hypothetical protein B0H14DRAFT_2982071 [Mycena olivaceomarginata]
MPPRKDFEIPLICFFFRIHANSRELNQVSFATSMDPNDGLGTPRPQWDVYTSDNPALMQLNGENTAMIPDNYRQNQIQYIMDNSAVFHH